MTEPAAPSAPAARVRVFVDYWNFQLALNEREAARRGVNDHRFRVNWPRVGAVLAANAATAAGVIAHSFEGVIIYASHDPRTEEGRKFHRWITSWLGKQPGVTVACRERKPKRPPQCPACHGTITRCPLCNEAIKGSQEKGVDTLIATDMIRLAWEKAYDLAVLATSDRDLVPAVEFLNLKGCRVIHAGFPPLGSDLARASWASFDVFAHRNELERPQDR